MANYTISDLIVHAVETEHHFHNRERWFGMKAVQTATDWGDDTVSTPYVLTSGNNAWGTEVQLLGTADTPVLTNMLLFDLHRLLVTDISQAANPYKVRIVWGTGTYAAAVAAGQYTETMFISGTSNANQFGGFPCDLIMWHIASGTKVWASCWCVTNLATISFYIGLHEYDAITPVPEVKIEGTKQTLDDLHDPSLAEISAVASGAVPAFTKNQKVAHIRWGGRVATINALDPDGK